MDVDWCWAGNLAVRIDDAAVGIEACGSASASGARCFAGYDVGGGVCGAVKLALIVGWAVFDIYAAANVTYAMAVVIVHTTLCLLE